MANSNSRLGSFESALDYIEAEIPKCLSARADSDFHPLRRALCEAIRIATQASFGEGLSFADHLSIAAKTPKGTREVATLMIRATSISHLVSAEHDVGNLRRNVIHLVQNAFPDIAKKFGIDEKAQTFESFQKVERLHDSIVGPLSMLQTVQADPRQIAASRQIIMRTLSDGACKEYLHFFGYADVRATIDVILALLVRLLETEDETYTETLEEIQTRIDDGFRYCDERKHFLTTRYLSPFLSSVRQSLTKLDAETRERFVCTLTPKRREPHLAEKRYPLYQDDRQIVVTIPFQNIGPGVALDVTAALISDSKDVVFENDISLGNVRPGDFALSFPLIVLTGCRSARLDATLTWKIAGTLEQKTATWSVELLSQDTNVDWKHLETADPYSLEVAEGHRFVGREAKVRSVGARFLRDRMVSSFISGQKRIGKTSLALAVQRFVDSNAGKTEYRIKYIEYGAYARMDPVETLEALGNELASFLMEFLSTSDSIGTPNLKGSIAPLNRIAQKLQEERPATKFIFILDEFDQLPPECYRYGALAEAFFSNLRAFSAQKNVALLLVGGEKMPHVMGAQGDKLNKFASEPLTYFHRASEWGDYTKLVAAPIDEPLNINWSEPALSHLFNVTYGHPYYTKLLCSRIFSTAVAERDAEITDSDVRHSVRALASELDSNSFAHLWKDGISSDGAEAQMRELQRCRVLLAAAKTLRDGEKLTGDTIYRHNTSKNLHRHEITPILQEFCRRELFKEVGGEYEFVVPLFGHWLKEKGVHRLVLDDLAEELETEYARNEEALYVGSGEIADLTRKWPIYRGDKITSEDVRAWLAQVKTNREQRYLFTLLKNLRFFSHAQIREYLRVAHSMVRPRLPEVIFTKRSDRRNDVLVTYTDGAAKSGAIFAGLYAEENSIGSHCVVPPGEVSQKILELEGKQQDVRALVLVDDIAATGRTLSSNLMKFSQSIGSILHDRSIPVFVIVITGSKDGENRIRETLGRINTFEADLRICEPMSDSMFAFPQTSKGFWRDQDERDRAKAVCTEIGTKIYKESPLGYGGLGLLVTFTQNCPNNSLPILHAGNSGWRPLFQRARN